jgi:two-component system, NarL family, response regulator LiaR
MKPILVTFVDEDPIVTEGLSMYIDAREEFTVTSHFMSAEDLFEGLKLNTFIKPDVLLINVGLPGMNGIDALPLILNHLPGVDIIILTKYEDADLIVSALKNGASAYVSKRPGLKYVAEAIDIVYKGGSYMSPAIAKQITNYFQNIIPISENELQTLSSRQSEILRLLVDGKTYKELADELFISVETVRTHIKKMYKILHVHNKAEAITKFMRGEIN